MPLPFSKLKLVFSRNLTLFPLPMVQSDGDNGAHWFVAEGPDFDRIAADQLSLREVTRRYYLQTAKMDHYIKSHKRKQRIPVPALYVMVKDDVMMNNSKVEKHVEKRVENAWLKYYSGGSKHKHFVLFTADREEVLHDVSAFLSGEGNTIQDARHHVLPNLN
jgi:hypothetical protein